MIFAQRVLFFTFLYNKTCWLYLNRLAFITLGMCISDKSESTLQSVTISRAITKKGFRKFMKLTLVFAFKPGLVIVPSLIVIL